MTDLKAEFRALLDRGLCQADALHVLHDFGEPKGALYSTAETARGTYSADDLEIDDTPLFSEADDGCWVSAWVLVPHEESDDAD